MTRKLKEQLINERLSKQPLEAAIAQFSYLNNGKLKASTIKRHWKNRSLGNLFKQFDPKKYEIFIKSM